MVALSPEPTAPQRARAALADLPAYVRPLLPSIRLLASELVTNSVRHAHLSPSEQIELTILETKDGVRVEVKDPGVGYEAASKGLDHLPAKRGPDEPLPEGGLGLLVVASLADRVGARWDGGTVLWAELNWRGRAAESGADHRTR
jgi:anti-sigma regulatory factor (Ser/Thr protein kinase)